MRQQAGALAEAALRDRLTHLAYLAEVLSAELDDRDARRRERRIHEARFPRLKHLADFDLAAAPTVDPAMLALERGEWIARILNLHGYPPDKQEQATLTVLEQAEVLSEGWAAV